MELQRPKATPTIRQWDLGIVSEALLGEPSFRHFTLKTVFLLTMFSVGRRSELHALGLTRTAYSSNRMGLVLHPTLAQSLCARIRSRIQVSGPWYIPAVPTGKPEFAAPNCPVRACVTIAGISLSFLD